MIIAAYNTCSFLDYPDHLAAVVFTKGCNMTCPYCHNKDLLTEKPMDQEIIFSHLKKRRHQLEGVVISGGEPTLQEDLIPFLKRVKAMGYPVKLDTNGTKPEVLKQLIDQALVDYIAMDIKTVEEAYDKLSGQKFSATEASLKVLRAFGHYELRTTLYPAISRQEVNQLCSIYHKDPYYLQQYRPNGPEDLRPYDKEVLLELKEKYGVGLRGI